MRGIGKKVTIFNQPWRLVQNLVRGEGGREIERFRGVELPIDSSSGSEAWVGSVTRAFNAPKDNLNLGLSEVVVPDGRCMLLQDAIQQDPHSVLGEAHYRRHGTNLGVLVKLLDAKRRYTLQAHPSRPVAQQLWGSPVGKEESWVVVGVRQDAAELPYILLGFKPGISREFFEDC